MRHTGHAIVIGLLGNSTVAGIVSTPLEFIRARMGGSIYPRKASDFSRATLRVAFDINQRGFKMADKGKIQLLITFVATADKVADVDRLVASHGAFMAETHHREGPNALLSYNFSSGPELSNALDPSSDPTGDTRYVLQEIYESAAGIEDHWQQASTKWADFGALVEMMKSCNPQTLHGGPIAESLW